MHKKRKASGVTQAPSSPRKECAMKMKVEELEKKLCARKNVIDGRGEFIRRLWKGLMDTNEP